MSLNDGVFVSNDPVNFFDPWGLTESDGTELGTDNGPAPPITLPRGPFGTSCGPEGASLATWIPDMFPEGCREHDECYATPATGDPEECRKECDDNFWRTNFAEGGPGPNVITPTIYWIAVRAGGQGAYTNAQNSNNSP